MHEPDWAVVVPVKCLAGAKTRLDPASLRVPLVEVVLAMAQDTITAVLACPLVSEVLVVTDDPRARTALAALGPRVVPDRPAAGLNPAITYGSSRAARPGRAVAALTADLPALRAPELASALRAAAQVPRAFVPDAGGCGTTLLAAHRGALLDPRFGARSAAAHQTSGARRLDGDWPSLRRDVDTVEDLVAAVRLGLGPHTAAQVAGLAPAPGEPLAGQRASGHDDGAA